MKNLHIQYNKLVGKEVDSKDYHLHFNIITYTDQYKQKLFCDFIEINNTGTIFGTEFLLWMTTPFIIQNMPFKFRF